MSSSDTGHRSNGSRAARSDAPALSADTVEPLTRLLRAPFDPVLSDPARLRLQAALHGLPAQGSMSFTVLRKTLDLSDGNLGAHLAMVVDAGYASATATWRGKRRTTRYAATAAGRAAFETHVHALESVIEAARGATALPEVRSEAGTPTPRLK